MPDIPFQLQEITGLYIATRPLTQDDILEQALQLVANSVARGASISDPSASRRYLTLQLSRLEHEVFACLFLDNRHRVLDYEQMFRGTIDGASVHPREVVKAALRHNAAAVILCHNHPSGIPEPSQADTQLTRRLQEALSMVDVRVLDHLIVGGDEIVSFAERGLL